MILTSTDTLRVVTAVSAEDVDVFAFYSDLSGSTVTSSRAQTTITTLTTTVVVTSPAASTSRLVKLLNIRNRDTSATTVTIELYNGSTAYELISAVLHAGETLCFSEDAGWRVLDASNGSVKFVSETTRAQPAVGAWYQYVTERDLAVTQIATNAIVQDVPHLKFQVRKGEQYWFRFRVFYAMSQASTGTAWVLLGPGDATVSNGVLYGKWQYPASSTTVAVNEGVMVYLDTPSGSASNAASTGSNMAILEGLITPTCDGDVWIGVRIEIASETCTVRAGSYVDWMRVR